MRVFQARYFGKCASCGGAIEPDQWVGYVDEDLIHDGCEATFTADPKKQVVCTRCFLVISPSGTCGCDDD
jgi:hypothetical protein